MQSVLAQQNRLQHPLNHLTRRRRPAPQAQTDQTLIAVNMNETLAAARYDMTDRRILKSRQMGHGQYCRLDIFNDHRNSPANVFGH